MQTVAEIRTEVSAFAGDGGKCPDSPRVLERINQARRFLWKLGDFPGTMGHFCVNALNDFAPMPNRLEAWRKVYTMNRTFEFENSTWGQFPCAPASESLKSDLSKGITTVGPYYTTYDPSDTPFRIRLQAEREEDHGKVITLVVTNEYGYIETHTITLADAHSPNHVLDTQLSIAIQSVVKPVTIGRIRVYARIYAENGIDYTEELLGYWYPYDINPTINRLSVNGYTNETLYVYGKLRYFPLVNETELVEFDTDAIIQAMEALKYRRAGDLEKLSKHMVAATDIEKKAKESLRSNLGGRMRFAQDMQGQTPIWM